MKRIGSRSTYSCRDILGVRYNEQRSRQLDMWRDLAQSCCWWWCYENYVVVSERPTLVSMDANERLHAADGPALTFADGWRVYAWHGARLDDELAQWTFDTFLPDELEAVDRLRPASDFIEYLKQLRKGTKRRKATR